MASGCGGGGDKTPAATLAPATSERTTTTLSVEQEVEAAYLKSWDVFAEAALELDESKSSESYAGPALELVRSNVDRLRSENVRGRYVVDHDYQIETNGDAATVEDNYLNHSVKLNSSSREPIEADPNERVREKYLMSKIGDQWKVVDIQR